MRYRSFLCVSVAAVLTGCASEPMVQTRNALDRNAAFVEQTVGRLSPRAEQRGNVTISPTIWLGDQAIHTETGGAVPDGKPVRINTAAGMTLADVAAIVAQQSGVPVSVLGTDTVPIQISYRGNLSGALDALHMRGINWRVVNGAVLLSDQDTQMIVVPRPLLVEPSLGGSLMTVSSGSDSTSGSSIGNTPLATADVKSAAKDPVWVALDHLGQQLPYPGVTFHTYPLLGLVTLHGPAAVVTATRELVEQRIRSLTQQTRVTVRILAVNFQRGRNFSANFTSAFSKLFGEPFTAAFDVTNGLSLTRGSLASGTSPGTTAALDTMATSSDVLDQRRFDFIVAPGVVKPINDTATSVYLASISPAEQSSTSTLATTPTIIQKSLTLGLSGWSTSQALTDRKIAISYHIAMSVLTSLNKIESGGYTLQQPSYTTDDLGTAQNVDSGTTVIAESRVIRAADEEGSGVFTPEFPIPGSRKVTFQKILILVLVSASVDHDNPETYARSADLSNILTATGEP